MPPSSFSCRTGEKHKKKHSENYKENFRFMAEDFYTNAPVALSARALRFVNVDLQQSKKTFRACRRRLGVKRARRVKSAFFTHFLEIFLSESRLRRARRHLGTSLAAAVAAALTFACLRASEQASERATTRRHSRRSVESTATFFSVCYTEFIGRCRPAAAAAAC